jgi:hypothetical protein
VVTDSETVNQIGIEVLDRESAAIDGDFEIVRIDHRFVEIDALDLRLDQIGRFIFLALRCQFAGQNKRSQ